MVTNTPLDGKDRRIVLKMFVRTVIFLVVLLAVYVVVFLANQRHGNSLVLDKSGAVDLSEWNFSEDGRNYLDSKWQFYPNQLLYPTIFYDPEFTDDTLPKYDSSTLPHYSDVSISTNGWVDLGWDAKANAEIDPMEATGSGTYRTVLNIPADSGAIAFDFPEINQAARIYLNGVLYEEIGKISTTIEGYEYAEAYTSIQIPPLSSGIVEIVILCSNYSTPFGGIAIAPAIGTPGQINEIQTASKVWLSSVLTLFLLIAVTGYYVSFTFMRKQKYYYFILIISISISYEFCDKVFTPLPLYWNKLLQATFFLLMSLVAALYFSSLYPKTEHDLFSRIKNWDILIIFAAICAFLTVYWLNPSLLNNKAAIVANTLFASIINLYNFFRVLYMTPRHPEEGTFHLISAAMGSIIFSTMLIRSPQIYFIPLHSVGIVILIFGTALYFTIRYVSNYNQISRFTVELERAVQEKTRSIARVNAELVNANQMLLKNEEARKKMMSNVSHDLRTPITAIRGYIELIMNLKGKTTRQNLEAYLNNMHIRSVQMEQLIDDLVQLTRLESDNADMMLQAVSLRDMIENLYELYVMECEGTNKKITLDLQDNDSLTIMGDPNRLLRVLENIIVNGLRYTEENGEIDIRGFREAALLGGDSIHIIIRDNGIGIPPAELPYIFDRFYRATNASVHKNGSGLGLSIVKSIVEKHKGKIWAESREKMGSRFHILFPGASIRDIERAKAAQAEKKNE
jgi:signal transduction histidine kinase